MTPYYADDLVSVFHGDCLDVLATLPDESVDAAVTDPPYLLGFMGKGWDTRAAHEHLGWHRAWCDEVFRVLKPGGHLLAFGGTRTAHRLACAIEDAGFELRDSIAWLYGSGFPKSLDVSKAIDKSAGAERAVTGPRTRVDGKAPGHASHGLLHEGRERRGLLPNVVTAPATPAAQQWQGWGTALKPAHEPIVVARKATVGTVAANVLAYGTGALNIDGCRIRFASAAGEAESKDKNRHADFGTEPGGNAVYGDFTMVERKNYDATGRWPTNVLLDPHAAADLDRQSGDRPGMPLAPNRKGDSPKGYGIGVLPDPDSLGYGDSGGASQFFPIFRYEAKAPADERPTVNGVLHPTVKPLDLMRWLVRLVTPPGGTVLEPFAGSGTTAEACVVEGFRCIAIEREADYLPLIIARLSKPIQPDIFGASA